MQNVLFLIFGVSGFSGLIYESVWTHYLKLFLGHAAYAQSLVLAIFMGGMAIGSWLSSRWSALLRNPLRAYALAEGAIGLFALAFHWVFTHAHDLALSSVIPALPSGWVVTAFKWSLGALLILPQSIILGATFPLMAAGLLRRLPDARGYTTAMLYFTNSLGGAVGILTSGFLLVRTIGLPGTIALAGAINVLLCVVVWVLAARMKTAMARVDPGGPAYASAPSLPTLMLAAAAITGAASFIYEITWIRLLTLVLGASTHAFELMLSAFILGLAFGGLWIRKRIDGIADPWRFLAVVQVAMGALALTTLPLYNQAFAVMQWLLKVLDKTDRGYLLFNLASDGIAMAVMLPATFCAGMTLPLITLVLLKGNHGERSIGAVYSANTLGGIAGVVFGMHFGMPLLGLKGLLTFGAGLDIALGVLLVWAAGGEATRRLRIALPALGLAAAGATLALVRLDPLRLASGVYRNQGLLQPDEDEVLAHKDGKTATIHLVRTADGVLFIRTNGKTDAAISMGRAQPRPDEATMTLAGALPLLLKPEAQTAANIGLGSGLTAQTLLGSPSLRSLDTIEIEQAMVDVAQGFRPRTELVYTDPRSRIWIDDAKSFFSSYNRRYDIIVSEPSNPWVSGVSALFSTEFYRQVRRYLKDDGLFVQWLQLYETNTDLVISVLKAVNENFRAYDIYAMNDVDIMVVATGAARVPQPNPRTLAGSPFFEVTRRLGVSNPRDLDLRWIGDRQSLEPLLLKSRVPTNSDYYPYLDQHATRARFLQQSAAGFLSLDEEFSAASQLSAHEPLVTTANAPLPSSTPFFARANQARMAALFADAVQNLPPGTLPPSLMLEPPIVSRAVYDLLAACAAPPGAGRDALLLRIAVKVNPFLRPEQSEGMWNALGVWPCGTGLLPHETRWVELFRAVGRRDSEEMARRGTEMLERAFPRQPALRRYLLAAAMLGTLTSGKRGTAQELWTRYRGPVFETGEPPPLFQLLAAHAAVAHARTSNTLVRDGRADKTGL